MHIRAHPGARKKTRNFAGLPYLFIGALLSAFILGIAPRVALCMALRALRIAHPFMLFSLFLVISIIL
jgi:hypothetical protein